MFGYSILGPEAITWLFRSVVPKFVPRNMHGHVQERESFKTFVSKEVSVGEARLGASSRS